MARLHAQLKRAFALLGAVTLMGCEPARHAVPSSLTETTQVPGFEGDKFWADEPSASYDKAVMEKDEQLVAARKDPACSHRIILPTPIFWQSLAETTRARSPQDFSMGWTKLGRRPTFGVVSGVSAGALAAPFAFLGPSYDYALRDIFTKLSAGSLYTGSGIFGVFGESLYSTAPLEKLIRSYATDEFLDKIAAEHRKGRRLLIMTTDLDTERPVIWYLSAIAASSRPDRRELFIKILLASSAVPGLFPPVEIPVVAANGERYEELHVDGGVTAELVFVPPEMKLPMIEDKVFGKPRSRNLYVIRNGKLVPEYRSSKLNALSLASRAVATMVKYQVVADIRALARDAKETGTNLYFNATPPSFDAVSRKAFDPAYAQRLYVVGSAVGRAGTWSTMIPASPQLVPH